MKLTNKHKWLLIILIGVVIFCIHGCQLIDKAKYNHAVKKENKLHLKYPELTDSLLHIWFPPQSTNQTVDTNKKDLDSIAYYKKVADSLSHLKPTIVHIPDTTGCPDDDEILIVDSTNYNNGYKDGKKIGYANGRLSCPVSTTTHDSTMTSQQKVLLKSLQEQNATLTSSNISLKTKIQDRNTAIAISIGTNILLLIGIGFALKKIIQKETTKPLL